MLPVMAAAFFVLLWVPTAARASQPEGPSRSSVFDEREIADAAALTPDDPEAYLTLAEEVLDRPDAPERIELARQLLVRAVEYGRVRKGAERIAASAALALASMSTRASERQWLRSVAATLHPDYAGLRATERTEHAAGARAAEVVTRLRAGEGLRPRELLSDPDVRAVLSHHEAGLSAEGTIGLADLDAAAKRQPCPGCGGRLLATTQGSRSASVCLTCKGRSTLSVSNRDFASQVRLQLRLLGAARDRWGDATEAEMLPARDSDAAEVAVVFGVDTKLSLWRDGAWQDSAKQQSRTPATDSKEAPPTVDPAR